MDSGRGRDTPWEAFWKERGNYVRSQPLVEVWARVSIVCRSEGGLLNTGRHKGTSWGS